jgi:hypothetical protein
MSYPEAIEALRGHHDFWWYEFHGRTDPAVQQLAIGLAQGVKPDPDPIPRYKPRCCGPNCRLQPAEAATDSPAS